MVTHEKDENQHPGPTSCRFDPILVEGSIGMFHCPDCGIMVLAGFPHFTDEECKYQLEEWEAPIYDAEDLREADLKS